MPTAHRRVLVTCTPEVVEIMAAGRQALGVGDGYPDSALLVALAERGLRTAGPGLMIRRASGRPITPEMVDAALDDD
jgi:hypothetical protein